MSRISSILYAALLAAPLALIPMAHAGAKPSGARALGRLELRFSHLERSGAQVAVARASGLTDSQNGLQIEPVSTGALEFGGVRYLFARFRVRNADDQGKAYTVAQSDLALVATGYWGADGTIAGTAVSKITRTDGSDYAEDPGLRKTLARTIQPAHAMVRDGARIKPIPDEADFVAFTEDEVNPKNFSPSTTLEALEANTVFPYGYAVRCVAHCENGPRTLRADPAPDEFDGAVTVAIKLPARANPNDDPAAFNLRLEVLGGNPPRITVSPEEGLDLGPALSRARLSGARAILAIGSGERTVSSEGYALVRDAFPASGGFVGIANVRTANPDPNPTMGDPTAFAQSVTLLPNPQELPTFTFPH